jgi:geranylgeranyl diphosphate synthase type I
MKTGGIEQLEKELRARHDIIYNYLKKEEYSRFFEPPDICDAVYSYINLGGKSLRPSVALFSCGAVGGKEELAIPLAAAIEVYHTWTLVHDDIIDRDKRRRGGPTVHEEWYMRALDMGYDEEEAKHYGQTVATITGDIQHAWAVSLLCELHTRKGLSPTLVLKLIHLLQTRVVSTLLKGETLDVQYSKIPPDQLEEPAILEMLWAKTGILYEFAGQAGAMIGLNTEDTQHTLVNALGSFASTCGLAFQLQDDVLGIIGDEKTMGKPVGSDIREGKRTVIVCHGFKNATKGQREKLTKTIGNRNAREDEIAETVNILRELGSIDYTIKLARARASDALSYLSPIPPSRYKDLLISWARYITERTY